MDHPTSNCLRQLEARGQSVWQDNITRSQLRKGELRRLIAQDGIKQFADAWDKLTEGTARKIETLGYTAGRPARSPRGTPLVS